MKFIGRHCWVILAVLTAYVMLVAILSADSSDQRKTPPTIRVAVQVSKSTLDLTIDSGFVVYALYDAETQIFRNATGWTGKVYSGSSGILFQSASDFKQDLAPCTKIMIAPSINGQIAVNGTYYYGSIALMREKDMSITAINYVDLESYLAGVLPAEMPLKWPDEALKAQAIAARTYAAAQMVRRSESAYDLFSTTASQVYKGRTTDRLEAERAALLVKATRGIILSHDDDVFPAYFSSSCGGSTEKANNVFADEKDILPLSGGVRCSYCQTSGDSQWNYSIKKNDIEHNLRMKGILERGLKDIRIARQGVSGRATEVELVFSTGKRIVNANLFRSLLGYRNLKSTHFEITNGGSKYSFSGKGWGHAVGMCQHGARGMAEKNNKCLDILKHYYPGSKILKIY